MSLAESLRPPIAPVRGSAQRRALVTDGSRGNALAFVRCLGRAGWQVTTAATRPDAIALKSRFTHAKLVYPDPKRSPAAFVAAVERTVREQRIDVVVPVTDATMLPLAAERHRFDGLCRLAIPATPALEIICDKQRTLEMGHSLGIPAPRSVLVASVEEALVAAEELGWPLVLKPRVSTRLMPDGRLESFHVAFAGDWDELAEAMGKLAGRVEVILQEYHPGTGLGVELLVDHGRVLAAFQHRRLREIPIHGGASAYRESVALDPTLYAWSARLLGELGWTGLAMVEFKVGVDGPRLMEVNGRPWGSLPLAVASGVDFPRLLAELLVDDARPEGPVPYRVGMRVRNLRFDLMWIAQVLAGRRSHPYLRTPRRREALGAFLDLFDLRVRFDVLSLEDPRPGLRELGGIVKKFRQKLSGGA